MALRDRNEKNGKMFYLMVDLRTQDPEESIIGVYENYKLAHTAMNKKAIMEVKPSLRVNKYSAETPDEGFTVFYITPISLRGNYHLFDRIYVYVLVPHDDREPLCGKRKVFVSKDSVFGFAQFNKVEPGSFSVVKRRLIVK